MAIASQQFGFVSGIFFFGYFIFEIPSNLLLHKIGARIWIARIIISWGILAILTGFVKTVFHLMGAISNKTGSFRGGLVFAGGSLFVSAMLLLALRKGTKQEPV